MIDVRKPEVRAFAKAVPDEVMELFPAGTPIHLGGDEVDTTMLSSKEQRARKQHTITRHQTFNE